MSNDLIERLEARLQLAERHGPISDSREVYIPSSWLPQILSTLRIGVNRAKALRIIAQVHALNAALEQEKTGAPKVPQFRPSPASTVEG